MNKNKSAFDFLSLLFIFLILFLFSQSLLAFKLPPNEQLQKGPKKVENAFQFQTHQNSLKKSITVEFNIAPYYYLYQDKIYLSFKNGEVIEKINPVLIGEELAIEDQFFGNIKIYKDKLTAYFDLSEFNQWNSVFINFQGCWEGGVCYPPQSTALNLSYGVDKNKVSLINLTNQIANGYKNQNSVLEILKNYSVWVIILIFFLLGFLLAFTPCVLPTFPLVYNIIIQNNQKDKNQSNLRNFYLALTFVISSALSYAIIGMVMGLFGQNIQFLLQKDWINLLAIVIILILSGSMFGFYSIQIPKKIQNKAASAFSQSRVSFYFGASLMGIFSSLIIGPCLAPPLAGVVLFLTDYGSAKIGALALFVMGLGMGLPLILLSTSLSGLFNKRGIFMVHIERLFGFLILFVAIYLADRLLEDKTILLLTGLNLLGICFYLFKIIKSIKLVFVKVLIYLIFMLSFIFSLTQITGFFVGAKYIFSPLEPILNKQKVSEIKNNNKNKIIVTNISDLQKSLNTAKNKQQIAVVKFTADWCISCAIIERKVFENQKVMDLTKNYQLIEADVTEVNQASSEMLNFYKLSGPPAIYFYNQSGELENNLTIIGLVELNQFLNNLNIMKQ